eukprot:TRINITY_DN9258_c0_g2_i1.p1 TRINITY_DN9258_c0_g2~~TRINITY_DN9258_c0_g2_i1.p1  ORF type:complete len:313 (+),score=63.20 TRINITY_DN9258_c0_g2_i1:33-971(+)
MDPIISSLVFFTSSFGLAYVGRELRKTRRELREIRRAESYYPSAVLASLRNVGRLSGFRKLSDNEYAGKVFVEGKVDSEHALSSTLFEEVKLVYRVLYKDNLYSNDRFREPTMKDYKYGLEHTVASPFLDLVDLEDGQTRCRVYKPIEARCRNALLSIGRREVFESLSLGDHLFSFILSLLEIINIFTGRTLEIRGIRVGYYEAELGIKVGSTLSVLGEVIVNTAKGTIKIDKPAIFTLDKESVLNSLKDKSLGQLFIFSLLLIPVGFSGYRLWRFFYNEYKRYLRRRQIKNNQNPNQPHNPDELQAQIGNV